MKRILILAAAAGVAGCAAVKDDQTYRDEAQRLLKRDFQARGAATLDRLEQDELQRACTQYSNKPPSEVAKRLEAAQLASIKYPADGKLVGDWRQGERIAQSGRGLTWSDKPDVRGGSCYNCHQLAPQTTSFGTVGPSLYQFGKLRGYGPDIQKYAYGRIYNSKAFSACSAMPRFGHFGALTEQQIKDLVALLVDPNSPVNK
jgi:L-cysteine S-thiosulfotransferase